MFLRGGGDDTEGSEGKEGTMTDPNQEAFEKDATHLGYVCTQVGEKYSLYTNMAWQLY